MITIIAAVARDGAIGRNGDQPFYISEDLKHFKALTSGHPIVMGRRTFEALPRGPLPGRHNIVVSRDEAFKADILGRYASAGDSKTRLTVAASPEEAIKAAGGEEAYVIGGGAIYSIFMPAADKLQLTEIDAEAEGADTFFPAIDPAEWELSEAGDWAEDEKSGARYRFVCYSRKK